MKCSEVLSDEKLKNSLPTYNLLKYLYANVPNFDDLILTQTCTSKQFIYGKKLFVEITPYNEKKFLESCEASTYNVNIRKTSNDENVFSFHNMNIGTLAIVIKSVL